MSLSDNDKESGTAGRGQASILDQRKTSLLREHRPQGSKWGDYADI